jgi:ferredoxin
VHIEAGAEHLSPPRRRERDTLGEDLLAAGYRLCCQTYVSGDVTISWDPAQEALFPERAAEKLKARWLSAADTD